MGISVFPQPASGGETKYSVFEEYNTDAESSSSTVTVSIPIGVYKLEQIGQPQTNSSTVAEQTTVGNQNKAIKFTSGVTSVAFNLKINPNINSTANNWVTRDSTTTNSLEKVIFGNGTYLAAGANDFATSTDSITWTTRTPPNSGNGITALAFGAGLFVVSQGGGQLYSSTNAITWTLRTSRFGTTQINGLTFGNNLFVAVGSLGKISTSTDGITWASTGSIFGTSTINAVAYGGGVYIAGGSAGLAATSTDGLTWTTQNMAFAATNINNIAYGNGLWIAEGQSTIATSTNGKTWINRGQPSGTTSISQVYYANGLFTGTGGSDAGFVKITTNGVTWQDQDAINWPSNTRTQQIVYNNGIYVLVGNGGNIRTSTLVKDKSNVGIIFTKLDAAE